MGDRAVILVQRGAPRDKQVATCLEWVALEHLPMETIVPHSAPEQAVRLVRRGTVGTVVVAFDSRAARAIAADIQGHGRVVVVHPTPFEICPPEPEHRRLPSLVELILRWRGKGRTVEEIAADLDGDTTDVRAILRRASEQRDHRAE